MCLGMPSRRIRCSLCSKIFHICVSCYRGQRFCCEDCRRKARKESRAAIQRRYRNSERGREKTKLWASAARRRRDHTLESETRTSEASAGKDENHTSPADAQRATALPSPEAMVAETTGGERRVQDDEASSTGEVWKPSSGWTPMEKSRRCNVCGQPLSGEVLQGRWTRRRKRIAARRANLRAPPVPE